MARSQTPFSSFRHAQPAAKTATTQYLSFFGSETVALKATDAGKPLYIHSKLLASISKPLAAAFESEFEEARKKAYVFRDVSDATLARFVQWAYTSDYPAEDAGTQEEEDVILDTEGNDTDDPYDRLFYDNSNGPFLAHIRLYIFANIYMISDLQRLAFDRATAVMKDINHLHDIDAQRHFIEALRISFTQLEIGDKLVGWLGQFAAYNVANLRGLPAFHQLLINVPTIGTTVMMSLSTAPAPWSKSDCSDDTANSSPFHGFRGSRGSRGGRGFG
ncbi:hypothetical protein BDW74DRAFT_177929 [Aspergillus multicolor]|uniref:BTB/POZ domain-containing protein n=1 Tax=Aspergillus multicolor TaxID=41759 RepID=UPI003CCDA6A8